MSTTTARFLSLFFVRHGSAGPRRDTTWVRSDSATRYPIHRRLGFALLAALGLLGPVACGPVEPDQALTMQATGEPDPRIVATPPNAFIINQPTATAFGAPATRTSGGRQ